MLKRFLLVSLLAVLLSAAAPLSAPASASSYRLNPFKLVNLARNGVFRDHGVPGFGRLSAAHQAGQITARDVIRAAIAEGRLSPEVLDDLRYVRSVEHHLIDLNDYRNN